MDVAPANAPATADEILAEKRRRLMQHVAAAAPSAPLTRLPDKSDEPVERLVDGGLEVAFRHERDGHVRAKPRSDAAPSGSRDPQKPRIVTPEELQISNFNEERAQQRQQAHQQLAAPRLQPLADDRKAPTAARETVTNMMGQAQFHEDDHVESNAPNPSTLVAFVQRRPKHRHESTHLTSSAKHACESACICESCDGRFCVSSERLPPPVISAPTSYFEAFVKASV